MGRFHVLTREDAADCDLGSFDSLTEAIAFAKVIEHVVCVVWIDWNALDEAAPAPTFWERGHRLVDRLMWLDLSLSADQAARRPTIAAPELDREPMIHRS